MNITNNNRIEYLKTLEHRWPNVCGNAITEVALVVAARIVNMGMFPCEDGGVLFECDDLSIRILPNGDIETCGTKNIEASVGTKEEIKATHIFGEKYKEALGNWQMTPFKNLPEKTRISLIIETKGRVYKNTQIDYPDELTVVSRDCRMSEILEKMLEDVMDTIEQHQENRLSETAYQHTEVYNGITRLDKYQSIAYMRDNINDCQIEAAARAIFDMWAQYEGSDATFDEIKMAGSDYKSLHDMYILSLQEGRAAIVAYLEEIIKE